jgi:diguanylate cyclase (GGDEF)-like protein/PAS domain S-box-containing protein
MLSRRTAVVAFATAIGAGVLLGLAGWPPPVRTLEFTGLILAAILTSILAPRQSTMKSSAAMAPAFIVYFTSLLLFGPHTTMLVVAAGAIAEKLKDSEGTDRWRIIVDAATVMLALQAAAAVHGALGGITGRFAWPWQAMPIAAALVVYCVVKGAVAEIVVPFITKKRIARSWPKNLLRGFPAHVIGASLAVALADLIAHEAWDVLPVAALPLFFAYRTYSAQMNRREDQQRSRDIIDALDEGMCVLDSEGHVTFWNDSLETILGCPRDRAVGRALASAVPTLDKTELPRAISEALTSRRPRTLAHLGVPSAASPRILRIRIIPVVDGVTLLWQDISERTRAEQALRRSEERFALAAEGANDGLWEWDLRTKEIYFSSRWRAIVGLPAQAGVGRPDEWMERVHPDDLAALKEAIEAHIAGKTEHVQHEHRIRHEDGTYRRCLCRGVAVRTAGGRPARIAGSLTDTTEGSIAQERLRNAGFLDPLTGLCNRAVFVEGIGRRLQELKARRRSNPFAILYLDLDRFKVVNDSLGHLIGDELLKAVSRRLESCLRQGDTLARLGGDELAILLTALGEEQQANAIAFRIQQALSEPFSIGGREVFTSASIGIAFGRVQYNNPDEIMRDADTAMYHAKSHGKARHEVFDADMHARALDRLGLENDLRHAVTNNAFELHYQPIVLLASGMCVGFESLVRWTRNGEPVSPATFIPIAEELGLIEQLGTWVLQQACLTFADWRRRFRDSSLEYITVNVSSRQLMQQNFLGLVEQAVHRSKLKPGDLRLEITETALMDSPNSAAKLLQDLRDFGVKIYLDDFGTGYSSLSHLHKLPVDALKIDRSFVRSLVLPDRPAIVESILALARTLNTSVVAEGIEEDVQARELARLGCTHAQGYLFSRPLSTKAAEELVAANRPLGATHAHASHAAPAPIVWPDYTATVSAATQSRRTALAESGSPAARPASAVR